MTDRPKKPPAADKAASETPPARHGGPRPGSGRPPGQGAFGEKTVPVRVPESLHPAVVATLDEYRRRRTAGLAKSAQTEACRKLERAYPVPAAPAALEPTRVALKEFITKVPAGFPSPADDHQDDGIDLNSLLVHNAPATFFYRVSGDSMNRVGILDGDRLVVDRSVEARPGDVVIALITGEGHTVKRFLRRPDGRPELAPESDNPLHKPRVFGRVRHHGRASERDDCYEAGTADDSEMCIWGVVTACIKQFRQR